MTCSLIHVDWSSRRKLYAEDLVEDKKPGVNIATNKRVSNDLKALLDSLVEDIDLSTGIILLPNESRDLYVKLNGGDIMGDDIDTIGRIHRRMKATNAKS
jgi:hypothetical protein